MSEEQINKLEKIKSSTKSKDFRDTIDKKIAKLKNGAKINKDGY